MDTPTCKQEYISLKDIFLKIGEYFQYVRSKLIWIVVAGFLVGAGMAIKALLTPTYYSESLTFMMDESKSGDMEIPGLDALGSLFGGGKKESSLGKILRLFESKRIIHNTLFDIVTINGKKDFIANHYINAYTIEGLAEQYEGMAGLTYKQAWVKELLKNKSFRFTKANVDNFSPEENLYLRAIYEKVSGNIALDIEPELSSNLDEDTGIMVLQMKSEHEELTLSILNNIYVQLSDFFIQKTVEKELKTYKLMEDKRDSIYGALTSSEYALANFKDSNRNLVTVKGYLNQIQLERQSSILGGMYSTVVRQMDVTEFALKNKTPVVQVIDLPRRPINPTVESWIKSLVLGGLVGAVLAAFLIVMKKLFMDIMQ